ncbi:MAG: hypothetical protein M9921_10125 [Fimbriimonadaceae bacterium]|nr:hypothetical protein [Fimbriimonadaceae bacterium]
MTEQSQAMTEYFQFLSAKGKHARQAKKEQGEATSKPPFGFRNVRADGKLRLSPDPVTFPQAMMALQMRRDGSTLREICTFMGKRGMVSRNGKMIRENGMHKILKTFSRIVDTVLGDQDSSEPQVVTGE